MTAEIIDLDEQRPVTASDIIWKCLLCGGMEFYAYGDFSLECVGCGNRSKDWLDSIDDPEESA